MIYFSANDAMKKELYGYEDLWSGYLY
jgi:hypothetical protein